MFFTSVKILLASPLLNLLIGTIFSFFNAINDIVHHLFTKLSIAYIDKFINIFADEYIVLSIITSKAARAFALTAFLHYSLLSASPNT